MVENETSTVAAWKQSWPINRNIGDRPLIEQIPHKSEALSDAECRRAELRIPEVMVLTNSATVRMMRTTKSLAGGITRGVSYAAME